MKMFPVEKLKYEEIGTEVEVNNIPLSPGSTVQILSKNMDYKLVIIRNWGSGVVYIGKNLPPADLQDFGFPLDSKEAIGISGYKGDLYATADAATNLRIAIFR